MVPATAWTVLMRNGFSLSRFPFVFNLDFFFQYNATNLVGAGHAVEDSRTGSSCSGL